jgi:pyruvate/2-oxoglutarate dehydrogenase complex dihydrolipoamide acyltransferase (E2) component
MSKRTPVVIPRENVNDETVTLVNWCVEHGTLVEAGQALADVEGSKAVFTIVAPVAGAVHYTLSPGQEVEVGGVLCTIAGNEALPLPAEVLPSQPETVQVTTTPVAQSDTLRSVAEAVPVLPEAGNDTPSISSGLRQPRFSQKAAALLQHHGLAPELFMGQGLVRAQEVLQRLEGHGLQTASPPAAGLTGHTDAVARPEPVAALGVPVHTVQLSRQKQTERRYLASSFSNTLPSMVTVVVPTRGLRAAAAQSPKFSGSVTALILFEVARLLHKYPALNAFYAHSAMHVYDEINIGFAVDAGQGLKVPVIHQADTKSLQDIASEMQECLLNYLENTLRVESLVGGTFTITDLSSEGVFTFQPLINQGQSAILGVGGEFFLPQSSEGLFNLILSFDHQLTEGRQAAQFLQDLAYRLQAYSAVLKSDMNHETGADELHCARCLASLSQLQRLGAVQQEEHFLVQTVQPDGRHEYRCNTCLQGW